MTRLLKAILAAALLAAPSLASASTCFWVPYAVTSAVTGTANAGQCKLVISAITGSGLQVGDTVTVAGISGATGCNVTTTVSAVDSSTAIELAGTTFGGVYTSGGTVGGGHWNTTNTTNWASGTGGTVGSCAASGGVPKQSADAATFDGSSGGGTITVDSAINGVSLTSLTAGAFTGTLDFSVNNPSLTLSNVFSISGAGTRTIKMGSGTFTMTGSSQTAWDAGTTTGLTFQGSLATYTFPSPGSFQNQGFNTGGLTYGTVNVSSRTNGATFLINNAGATFTTFNVTAPNLIFLAQAGAAFTVTNALTWAGTPSSPILLASQNETVATKLTAATSTISGVMMRWVTFQVGTVTCNNCLDLNHQNTGVTINPPNAAGGAGNIISGG